VQQRWIAMTQVHVRKRTQPTPAENSRQTIDGQGAIEGLSAALRERASNQRTLNGLLDAKVPRNLPQARRAPTEGLPSGKQASPRTKSLAPVLRHYWRVQLAGVFARLRIVDVDHSTRSEKRHRRSRM